MSKVSSGLVHIEAKHNAEQMFSSVILVVEFAILEIGLANIKHHIKQKVGGKIWRIS